MEKFETLIATAVPLSLDNVDTDQIIPKQFLKTTQRSGLGQGLFHDLRFNDNGTPKPDFILNNPAYKNAKILLVGENFGCGSSREHAPWALLDFGIRCVIAPSFADIFYNNCFKNGILPIRLPREQVAVLTQLAENDPEAFFTVSLPDQAITTGAFRLPFRLDADRKKCLLEGLDDISQTEKHDTSIKTYEKRQAKEKPWLGTK